SSCAIGPQPLFSGRESLASLARGVVLAKSQQVGSTSAPARASAPEHRLGANGPFRGGDSACVGPPAGARHARLGGWYPAWVGPRGARPNSKPPSGQAVTNSGRDRLLAGRDPLDEVRRADRSGRRLDAGRHGREAVGQRSITEQSVD